ncbi:hypothetical protein ACFQ0G_41290 [Streptomyces chiangmaiensis]|uniref:Glycosyl hydrolase family 95 catalytic domain-containing protein n=1 Tax=Streptomyces chiangmaiensis TaxID=766497 RepID=A0ABU7FNE1_9ACTN|nr:hypothetical protein [Streptomyces chiangmaiensis]MED7825641.1 hypothetical protein [Streptomyces chiangmaiensis]
MSFDPFDRPSRRSLLALAAATGALATFPATAAPRRPASSPEIDGGSRLNGAPDPELEAVSLQFGRYLMIAGSRGSLPMGLQGLWLDAGVKDFGR